MDQATLVCLGWGYLPLPCARSEAGSTPAAGRQSLLRAAARLAAVRPQRTHMMHVRSPLCSWMSTTLWPGLWARETRAQRRAMAPAANSHHRLVAQ